MVPTFGMFDFLPVRLATLKADDAEREAFLSEVTRNSTEFGVGARNEARLYEDSLRAELMSRF